MSILKLRRRDIIAKLSLGLFLLLIREQHCSPLLQVAGPEFAMQHPSWDPCDPQSRAGPGARGLADWLSEENTD